MKRLVLVIMLALCACGQSRRAAIEDTVEWVCPMDPDVRAKSPGKCPRCGMDLVAGIADPVEYPVRMDVEPAVFHAGDAVTLRFNVSDPKTHAPVRQFNIVHEKLMHLFVVSRDLTWFAHEHPAIQPDGSFVFRTVLPKTGEYRLLSDFYPAGGTPQMVANTLIAPGPSPRAALSPDLALKQCANLRVRLRTQPDPVLAGQKTLLFFDVDPLDGLEPYLGAWGHLLAASADLVDMIHTHPAFEDPGRTIQFNVIFPRPGLYRLWVQFQRRGEVNTAAFNVPVSELK